MAFLRGLVCALVIATATSARDDIKPHFQTSPAKEKAAQALVALLLKERGVNAVTTNGDGMMQWIPATAPEAQEGDLSQEAAELEMRAEFEEALDKDLVELFEREVGEIKNELQPIYMSLQKNENGDLGHTAVRYALHRLFVSRHGWYIHGIDPEGGSYASASPASVLKDLIPSNVQQLIEKLLYGRGFGLSEVAVLGAILENVIHQEAVKRTKLLIRFFGTDGASTVEAAKVDFAMDNYMAAYVAGKDVTRLSKKALAALLEVIPRAFPAWKETQEFVRKVRTDKYGNKDLSYQEIGMLAIAVGEKYGGFQNAECLVLKKSLMTLEDAKDGCVSTANFYNSLATGGAAWVQFSEKPEYLKELGALDESNAQPKVMIANYLDSAANCVASSTYYSVCCHNEGEEILGRIEKHFQASDALPDELATFVADLPSSTVTSGRTLPAPLLEKLGKIAEVHDGRVPLHSRLFMQWMHNAYPHEVPWPNVVGTTRPRLPEAYLRQEKKDPNMSPEAARAMIKADADAKKLHKQGACGQWLNKEELYVPWHSHPVHEEMARRLAASDSHVSIGAYGMALLAAIASMILMVMQVTKALRSTMKSGQATKMIVA